MKNTVIVLGAKGRFGQAVVKTLLAEGWKVTALARNWNTTPRHPGAEHLSIDASDEKALCKACKGHDVIINAINPPYEKWERELPRITRNVIAAGLAANATVLIPGNIYNYGKELPAKLSEITPHVPNIKKGRLRIEMERAYEKAATRGLQTIVLRGGDFIDSRDTGNWFESYITNKLHKGIITYPGRLNATHSWAYLPDMAKAMVALAEKRESLKPFETICFRGYAITGQELLEALERITGRDLKTKRFPWPLIRLLGLFNKQIGEVVEMRYLWDRPHEMDETKLRSLLPDYQTTPFDIALRQSLSTRFNLKDAALMPIPV